MKSNSIMWASKLRQSVHSANSLRRNMTTKIRVRFAPSPTGYLHLGGLRTALYNYLFSKSRGGSFILRIEDTDQSRKVEGSLNAIVRDLEWAGIECQEGPGFGGIYGPYVQSERLEIYRKYINTLIENGSAYYCFCTEHRLNILRRDAMRHGLIPKYDNKCRDLSKEDIKEKMKENTPYCVRFKLTSSCCTFDDLIFGSIAYDVSLNEGDPVLMKSDGYPTYHFANVVDDKLMEITHVLRGVEWQISTTKHLQIYRAFGWDVPQFGHLPLIVNPDGTKLSKRQSDVKVEDYREKGIFPLALINYITLSGGGFEHVPGAGVRIKTMEELANEIGRVSSHPSRLNREMLEECNRLELKRQLKDSNLRPELISKIQKFVKDKYPDQNFNLAFDHVAAILDWSISRVSRIEDLLSPDFAFLWILPSEKQIDVNKTLLKTLIANIEEIETFDENSLKKFLKDFAANNDVKFSSLMKTLRSILSGLKEGPGVSEMMHLVGKSQTLERIKAAI